MLVGGGRNGSQTMDKRSDKSEEPPDGSIYGRQEVCAFSEGPAGLSHDS